MSNVKPVNNLITGNGIPKALFCQSIEKLPSGQYQLTIFDELHINILHQATRSSFDAARREVLHWIYSVTPAGNGGGSNSRKPKTPKFPNA